MRPSCRALAAAAILVVLLAGPLARAQVAAPEPTGEIPAARQNFSLTFRQNLSRFARSKTGGDTSIYWAIVRRGLDAADNLAAPSEASLNALNLETLDKAPTDFDRSLQGQMTTRARLRLTSSEARIIGGIPVPAGTRNDVVAIVGHDHICSGIAVAPALVLTAAHCVGLLHLNISDETKLVVVTHDTHSNAAIRFDVTGARVFGGAPCESVPLSVDCPDLALVTISGSLPESAPSFGTDAFLSASLPRPSAAASGFYLYGFGCSKPLRSQTGEQHCLASRIGIKMTAVAYKSFDCATPTLSNCRDGEFILSDDRETVDTCAGDSGGPVFLPPKQPDGSGPRLVGLTSRSWSMSGECGAGGIYTKLTSDRIIGWLKENGAHVNFN